MLESRECPVCGKSFIKAKECIYKLLIGGKTQYYCSYTCYKKAQEKKRRTVKQRRRVG